MHYTVPTHDELLITASVVSFVDPTCSICSIDDCCICIALLIIVVTSAGEGGLNVLASA